MIAGNFPSCVIKNIRKGCKPLLGLCGIPIDVIYHLEVNVMRNKSLCSAEGFKAPHSGIAAVIRFLVTLHIIYPVFRILIRGLLRRMVKILIFCHRSSLQII